MKEWMPYLTSNAVPLSPTGLYDLNEHRRHGDTIFSATGSGPMSRCPSGDSDAAQLHRLGKTHSSVTGSLMMGPRRSARQAVHELLGDAAFGMTA